jgi:hypothetical protein
MPQKTSVKIANLWAEILIKDLSNTKKSVNNEVQHIHALGVWLKTCTNSFMDLENSSSYLLVAI